MNTKFHYFYRDADNYKVHSSVVFSGPPSDAARARVMDHEEEFLPGQVGIPALQDQMITDPNYSEEGSDHVWHEVSEIEETDEPATLAMTFEEFASSFPDSRDGWDVPAEMLRVGAE